MEGTVVVPETPPYRKRTESPRQGSSNERNRKHQKIYSDQLVKEQQKIISASIVNFQDGNLHRRHDVPSSFWVELKTTYAEQNTVELVVQKYSPPYLEEAFRSLYRSLQPSLVTSTSDDAAVSTAASNSSALVQGPRGCGKSLVVARVMQALRDEHEANITASVASGSRGSDAEIMKRSQAFRLVSLNGLVLPGHDVAMVVREILRQLTSAAQSETQLKLRNDTEYKKQPTSKSDKAVEKFLSLERQQSSFVNNLQLLNEILEIAQLDGVPIVIMLDELDAFLGDGDNHSASTGGLAGGVLDDRISSSNTVNSNRQVLLYHLLDRVATDGSLLSLVGITCHSALLRRLEKRIQSRAQGTTTTIVMGPLKSDLAHLQQVVMKQSPALLQACPSVATTIERVHGSYLNTANRDSDDQSRTVYETLERDLRLGKPVRWFMRVWAIALSLYQWDLRERNDAVFSEDHLLQALADMGGSIPSTGSTMNNPVRIVHGQATDVRLRAMQDVSAPQATILVATRRLLARDNRRHDTSGAETTSNSHPPPLTCERLLAECESYQKTRNRRYDTGILVQALHKLLDVGLLRPAADNSGGGALQYLHKKSNSLHSQTLFRQMPLQCTIDIHREFPAILEQNLMGCSTALKEWSKI